MHIYQPGGPKTTILLSPEQGEEIRSILEKNINSRFTTYCTQVGLQYTNVQAMLTGRKRISLDTFERLFSGIDYVVECRTEFVIQKQTTSTANDAPSTSLEEELFFEDMDESPMEQLNEKEDFFTTTENSKKETKKESSPQDEVSFVPPSFSSEKHQDKQRTSLESHSSERQDES
jgi:hypothetical protein